MRPSSLRRRALALAGISAVAALTLSACSSPDSTDTDTSTGGDAATTYSIGISQYAPHPALDAATEGFKKALEDAGIDADIDFQNAQGEQPQAVTIADTFAEANLDLILAVATPAAQALAQKVDSVPVLFTAVTDPVAAELVESNEAPGFNLTGTSDAVPADALAGQFDLILELAPDAKKVGIVYASGEVNSEVQVADATKVAGELGIEIVTQTVTTANDIAQATEALGDVDAIYVPTDNMVVAGVSALIKVAEEKKIPVIAAEAGTVESGAIATLGIDYFQLGYETGEMAVKILQGAQPESTPVQFASKLANTVNPAAAERMGVTLPESLLAEADIVE